MTIHPSHTLTRDGHNGLCDPWHRCTMCGATDAQLVEPCATERDDAALALDGLVEAQQSLDMALAALDRAVNRPGLAARGDKISATLARFYQDAATAVFEVDEANEGRTS